MKINADHLYHGAALNQIAEHEQFTAINALEIQGRTSRSAFKINNKTSVYIKYSTKPIGAYNEYKFTFRKEHLKELKKINEIGDDLHLALVCYKDREICCIPYLTLADMIKKHQQAAGKKKSQYQLLATLKPREAFRVYMNDPRKKGGILGESKIRRNRFPKALFE